MILDYTISNFRSIREAQTLSFEANSDNHLEDYYVVKIDKYRILKIATILGANASGKSNILRAFSLFPLLMLNPCETKSSKIGYDQFALDNNMEKEYSKMIINFICDNINYRYEIHFNNDIIKYELLQAHPFGEIRAHKVFERILDIDTTLSEIKWGNKYSSIGNTRDLSVNLLPNRTVFGSFQKSNVNIPWMKKIIDWADSYILPIVKTSEQHLSDYTSRLLSNNNIDKEQVKMLLRTADIGVSDFVLKKEIRDIPQPLIELILKDDSAPEPLKNKVMDDPTTEDINVKMIHNGAQGGVELDFNEESNGTKRYYELSSILLKLTNESHFVTVDELESRMHPDLYQHFLNTYLSNAKNSQLVFTTHMREFLNDRDLFRDDSVWFTEKNDIGATQLYSLADFGSDILRNSSNRYNAYRIGRLGAIPNLGGTHINIENRQ